MSKIKISILLLLLSLGLVACSKGADKNVVIDEKRVEKADLNQIEEKLDKTKVYGDQEGLVEVHVEGKKVDLYFLLDKWEEVFKLSQIPDGGDFITYFNHEDWRGKLGLVDEKSLGDKYYGPFSIINLPGHVKDVVIGQVEDFDYYSDMENIVPTIFLLMDDGRVYHIPSYIFLPQENLTYFDIGDPLPWLSSIESLSYENDGEGFGAMTVYGVDSEGNKLDTRIAFSFKDLYNGMSWVSNEKAQEPNAEFTYPEYCLVLDFLEDGHVTLTKGWTGEKPTIYEGTYKISMGKGDTRPGIIFFDLVLREGHPHIEETIIGSYIADIYKGFVLNLYPNEGDFICLGGMEDGDELHFSLGYNPFIYHMNYGLEEPIEDYGQYLIESVARARKMVFEYSMTILDTGEYTDFGNEMARNIWLGTNHQGHFVKEILYSITDDGTIYEYDPIGDGWTIAW